MNLKPFKWVAFWWLCFSPRDNPAFYQRKTNFCLQKAVACKRHNCGISCMSYVWRELLRRTPFFSLKYVCTYTCLNLPECNTQLCKYILRVLQELKSCVMPLEADLQRLKQQHRWKMSTYHKCLRPLIKLQSPWWTSTLRNDCWKWRRKTAWKAEQLMFQFISINYVWNCWELVT